MIVRSSTGIKEILQRTQMGWQGEIALATDIGHLFYCAMTEQPFVPIQTLPLAVCHEDQVVCYDNEIVYKV